jgi:hypothetical protein
MEFEMKKKSKNEKTKSKKETSKELKANLSSESQKKVSGGKVIMPWSDEGKKNLKESVINPGNWKI